MTCSDKIRLSQSQLLVRIVRDVRLSVFKKGRVGIR